MSSSDFPQLQPFDEHNQRLSESVSPHDTWTNPVADGPYNMVVIGAGTAGLVCAAGAAGLGAKVALIEKEMMGGDCLNVGCVPSKAIIGAARAAAAFKNADEFGIEITSDPVIHFDKAMERMRKLRADIGPHDSVQRFADLGIDVFLGGGKFVGENKIEVAGQTLEFRKAVIATGARASAPPIEGLDKVPHLTNETLFSLTKLPKKFGIIGGGPIGCEMAQSFARLGSEVYLVEAAHGVLSKEDKDAGDLVGAALERDGVNLLCCGKELVLQPGSGSKVRMTVDSHQEKYDIEVDQLLVAVGRAPNVEGLGLEDVGVEFTKKGVVVNDKYQTTNKNIYAAGDICSPYQFTHAADFMARAVIANALFKGRSKGSSLVIPWATYTSPEVAHVGLTPNMAGDQGVDIDTYTIQLSEVDRAILEGETEGFVRIHVKKGTDKIVGGTVVAEHGGDMIGEIVLAMTQGIGLGKVANVIHPYPTIGEAIRKAGDLYNRTRLTPTVKSLMEKWLRFQRR